MEKIESFHGDITGSSPGLGILFFFSLGNFRMAKKGWSSHFQPNLTSPIFFYAFENPFSLGFVLDSIEINIIGKMHPTLVKLKIYKYNISVYISSQPESIDFDQESNSSFDASLINELMTNCQNNPPVDMSRDVFYIQTTHVDASFA